MKFRKNSSKVKGNYTNPELEAYIQKEHLNRLLPHAQNLGIALGIKRSAEGNRSLQSLTASIYAGYNEVVSYAHRANQAALELKHGEIDVSYIKRNNQKLDAEKLKAESAWKTKQQQLGDARANNNSYFTLAFGLFLAVVVMIFDVLYISTAFQVTGEVLFKSIMMGIGISVSLAAIGILGSAWIERIEDKIKRKISYAGLLLFVAAGLFVICKIRSDYFFQMTGREVSPWAFLLLNLIALASFHFIAKMVIIPAWEQVKQTRQIVRRQKELRRLKKEYYAIDEEMMANETHKEEVRKFKLSVLSYAQSIEELIQRLYETALSECTRAYIEESGTVPDCFNDPVPTLRKFYDDYSIDDDARPTMPGQAPALIIALAMLSSCAGGLNTPKGTSVEILIDITDTFRFVQELKAEDLKSHFSICNNHNAPARFRVGTIENLMYTKTSEFSVAGVSELEANALDRKALSEKFYGNLQQAISQTQSLKAGRNGSYIAYAISRALNNLKSDTGYADRKLICLTDALEHSSVLNCYRPRDIWLIHNKPDSVFRILDREYPLPPLDGITILFVFRSQNVKEDNAFHRVSGFWKRYYESKGAQVSIASTIPKGLYGAE